jgi:hypothetical protein
MAFNSSPLTSLVLTLDAGERPRYQRGGMTPMQIRERIYRAAADEMAYKASLGCVYDPAGDARFRWLLEWADIVEGTRRQFTYGLESSMRFIFMPVDSLLTGKNYAAGERREPTSLVQRP